MQPQHHNFLYMCLSHYQTLLIALFILPICSIIPAPTRKNAVRDWISSQPSTPLSNTILCLPPEWFAEDVVYSQKATNVRIERCLNLKMLCEKWEQSFETTSEDKKNVRMSLGRVSETSPTSMLVQWNLTWVPPTALWLETLAHVNGWTLKYCPYTHLSDRVSTFSYKAVGKLLWDAWTTQQLNIPLACIRGITQYEFADATDDACIVSIKEDLSLAQDLNCGRLRNRKCAQDLKLFLETGRSDIKTNNEEEWYEQVAKSLPWSTVPGMNPLEIDPNEETAAPAVFLGVSVLIIIGFATIVAPELIGQSLFGPPAYVVPPSEINSIF